MAPYIVVVLRSTYRLVVSSISQVLYGVKVALQGCHRRRRRLRIRNREYIVSFLAYVLRTTRAAQHHAHALLVGGGGEGGEGGEERTHPGHG